MAHPLAPQSLFMAAGAEVACHSPRRRFQAYHILQAPMYHDFRRAILLPEFKDVVFHRMVDIGRCPRCQYIEWKFASVPLEMRTMWQEALGTHHQIQIAQKQCYAADRAKAASGFPKSTCRLRWIAAVGMNSFSHIYPRQIVRGLTSCWTT